MSKGQMMYFDAKNLSDILMHLFMSMNMEVSHDGLEKEFADMLFLFDGYLWPFMTEEEKEKVKKFDSGIGMAVKKKNSKTLVEKFRYLMEIANKKKFLRKAAEFQGDMKSWGV